MKNIRVFLSENFQFLEVKFSIYFNRRVFVMNWKNGIEVDCFKHPVRQPRFLVKGARVSICVFFSSSTYLLTLSSCEICCTCN